MKMNNESGRSMIEMMGVMAIAAIMTVAAITMYNVVRTRQIRMVAVEDMKNIADRTKMLYLGRADYTGISKDYLLKAGALKTEKSPLSGTDFDVFAEPGAKEFALVFHDADFKTCAWLATQNFEWSSRIDINGFTESPGTYCRETDKNEISIFVK